MPSSLHLPFSNLFAKTHGKLGISLPSATWIANLPQYSTFDGNYIGFPVHTSLLQVEPSSVIINASLTVTKSTFTTITGTKQLVTPLINSSSVTGSSAYFNSKTGTYVYYPQITGSSAFFSNYTVTNISASNIINSNLTISIAFFNSSISIPTSTGSPISVSIYFITSDNKLHCYNGTGWVSATCS